MKRPLSSNQGRPEVRARFLKVHEDELRATPRGPQVMALIDPPALAAVRAAFGFDWLPIQYELEFTRATYAALGQAEAEAHIRRHALGTTTSPLLESVLRTALNLVGRSPALLAHRLPLAWNLAFRNCGTWTVEIRGTTEAVFELGGIPPVLALNTQWLQSAVPALSAMLDVAMVTGEVRLVDRGIAAATYVMTWSEGRPPGP